jgi:hypothetical protein
MLTMQTAPVLASPASWRSPQRGGIAGRAGHVHGTMVMHQHCLAQTNLTVITIHASRHGDLVARAVHLTEILKVCSILDYS